ncbi:YbaB/EbfC family nucleoid-associated protein [Sporichthya polymorpha]|uniref:YbaB/EbfC family nucleoid-associated protein n=1 Tax=Sporichthya polymorpha TaxID=35751 RepID=UPI0003638012|nr:YbaB/EbfC family nucleoid-associated protein [Sporichthya polymorpha]
MTTGGMPDMGALLAQAAQMQQQILEVQARLAETKVTGSAGGGAVRATVTGSLELVGLDLDPSVVDPTDTETLADLIVAAVRDANRAAQEMQAQAMGPFAAAMGGMGGMVEGMGLDASSFGLGASGGLGGLPPGR